jgi:cellulase (glycosyl hydrolase family 5)
MIDDFNFADWLDNWSIELGEEFPGAKGMLVADRGFQGGGASLRFDFSCFRAIGACNPHYVGASRKFDEPIAGEALSLWVRCDACEPIFRITDASGQRLVYGPVALPLAADSLDAWHRVVLSLRGDIVKYQGGANDGIFHPGITEIRIIAQEDDILARTGVLRFDQLRLHDSLADAFSQEVSLAFPAGSFRAPSDSAVKTSRILGGVKSDDVAEAAAAGFSFHRMNLAWRGVERKPGEYDFHRYDQIVQEARNRGMSTLFMLGLGHPAYTGGSTTPPRSDRELDAFANYVSAAAKHFKGKRVAYEIWNEPNFPYFWPPTPSAKEYGKLLRRAIGAIRRVDPDITIITGGLRGWGDDTWQYLAELIKSKSVTGADFFGIHTYTEQKIGEPEGRWRHLLRGLEVVEGSMAKPLPFWSTEWGFSSTLLDPADNGHRARSRRAQAVMIVRELLVWRLAGMPENVYHTLADGCDDPADPECNFGLMTDASEDKPAMVAVETLDGQLRSLELTGILEQKDTLPPWLNVARFRGAGA